MSARTILVVPLCAVLLVAARGEELPLETPETPVELPAGLKAPLLKRITIKKATEGTLTDLVKRLADENKLKVEFDPGFLKFYPYSERVKVTALEAKEIRLDIALDGLFRQAGAAPTCVVKKDALVFVSGNDAAITRPDKSQALQTMLQPPDAKHAATAAALKKKLAIKTDIEASSNTPLMEFLIAVARKHGLTFQLRGHLFAQRGITNIGGAKPLVAAAKDTPLETILRDALRSVEADMLVDSYGHLAIVPKSTASKK